MIVLGIDPGPTWSGGALLKAERRAWWIWSDKIESATAWVRIDGLLLTGPIDLIAIETPGRVHPTRGGVSPATARAIATQLVATTRVATEIRVRAELSGIRVVELEAKAWRRSLGVRTDKDVRTLIPRLVAAWPRSSNVHTRDAAGVALFGARLPRNTRGL